MTGVDPRKWTRNGLGLMILGSCLAGIAVAAETEKEKGEDKAILAHVLGVDGKKVDLGAPKDGATVVVFYSTECPISNAYSPTLNRLRDEYPASKLNLVGICVDPDLSNAEITTHARDFELKFPVARDRGGKVAAKLGATVTPEAFVIDSAQKIRYHGRIDDQFVARQKRNAHPNGNDLQDALAALLDGRPINNAFVAPVGCPIPRPVEPKVIPTYSNEVSRIIQKNCQECHRRGQIGPFALDTYDQAKKRADDLANVVEDRQMPPWKADAGFGPKFKHDRSLSQQDIEALRVWADAGAPEGDCSQLPPPAQFADGWLHGTPDLVLELPEEFSIPASGEDIYRCFVLPTNLPEDVYISAVEYRPGNARVVHHILGFVDNHGAARKKDEAEPGQGYTCFSGPGIEFHGDLDGWAPGKIPSALSDGVGRSLPKGADVVVQIHYHPNGKAETDRSKIGLYFSKTPVKSILHWSAAMKHDLKLPPNESNIEVKAAWPVPVDLVAWSVAPHMHLLGHDMKMSLTFPDGRTQDLIKISDWDFGWQYTYDFEKPIELPKGTLVNVVAHFDNSEGNPHNPSHPPKLVTWGEATTDEMCIGFIAVTKKGQDLTKPGEKDDLLSIFREQRESYERALRERKAKDKDKAE
ncbi:redoxin domain-containing protein [Singulisphaera sp. PoT]|uniref:redoxin domain-containing protein n=1 Tax=Singulisphaera sp. PoT TaxID=3411797 RepID=UPI003BF5F77B